MGLNYNNFSLLLVYQKSQVHSAFLEGDRSLKLKRILIRKVLLSEWTGLLILVNILKTSSGDICQDQYSVSLFCSLPKGLGH